FKSNNRYRDVIASPEGNTLYVLTDTAGNVQKDDGSVNVFWSNTTATAH
ncbi:hypothetical protein RFX40_00885, partial [Acinetobacter baumannii]|nr:hypothetical protein [Acinetobacter baumannii]